MPAALNLFSPANIAALRGQYCASRGLASRYGRTHCSTASNANNRAVAVDCDSRRAFGPTKTIRGVFWTQLNRLERLAVLSALRERSF